jgi:hypothetical protein
MKDSVIINFHVPSEEQRNRYKAAAALLGTTLTKICIDALDEAVRKAEVLSSSSSTQEVRSDD